MFNPFENIASPFDSIADVAGDALSMPQRAAVGLVKADLRLLRKPTIKNLKRVLDASGHPTLAGPGAIQDIIKGKKPAVVRNALDPNNTPSKSLGLTGAKGIAADIVLDPLNVVPIGAIGKVKGAGKVLKEVQAGKTAIKVAPTSKQGPIGIMAASEQKLPGRVVRQKRAPAAKPNPPKNNKPSGQTSVDSLFYGPLEGSTTKPNLLKPRGKASSPRPTNDPIYDLMWGGNTNYSVGPKRKLLKEMVDKNKGVDRSAEDLFYGDSLQGGELTPLQEIDGLIKNDPEFKSSPEVWRLLVGKHESSNIKKFMAHHGNSSKQLREWIDWAKGQGAKKVDISPPDKPGSQTLSMKEIEAMQRWLKSQGR